MNNYSFLRPLLALFFALLLGAAPAAAQDDADYPRVGAGITITDINTVFASTSTEGRNFVPLPNLLVSIDVSENFRVEPLLGVLRQRTETDFPSDEQFPDDSEQTLTGLRLGVGLFGRSLRDDAALYYGARVGYNRLSTDDGEDDESDPLDGFFIGPTVGGSYYFADFFSIGGDVELRYTRFSSEDEFGGETITTTNSTIAIKPSLAVRFYF